MRSSWALGSLLAVAVALMLIVWAPWRHESLVPTEANVPIAAGDVDLAALREEVQALREELKRLERDQQWRSQDRAPVSAPVDSSVSALVTAPDALQFLEQYALSFLEEEQGSEFLRLAVESRIAELVSPVCVMLRDSTRVPALRRALASMLGKKRFHGSGEVNAALLVVVAPPSPAELSVQALKSLEVTGDLNTLASIERVVFDFEVDLLRARGLDCARALAKDAWNACVLRLFLRAPTLPWKQDLIRRLDAADLESALQVFVSASTIEQPVRLAAAQRIGDFPFDEFRAYVQQWLGFETDAEVIAALRGSLQRQEQLPGWHALQACGAPNANPKQDDPKAWAPSSAEAGKQWLELSYPQAIVASGVRIYEVCAPGAVCELWVRGPNLPWRKVHEAAQTPSSQPLLMEFEAIAGVQSIRLVLDTDRVSGWNEIDAVELIGPGVAQWAKSARASSTYGGGFLLENLALQRAVLDKR